MAVPTVDEKSFRNEVMASELPVLVDFYADWCAPCKQMAPEVEALANELEGKAKVVKVNIDKSPALAQSLRIQSVPTTMVFAKGRPVDAQVGALRRTQLRQMIEPFLPRSEGALLPNELVQLLGQHQVVPVDIREAAVFARAHLPAAVNFPEDQIETRLAELHMLPGEPVLYCRAGDKSKALAEKLAEAGVPVAFLEGGLLGWEAEGLPLERPDLAPRGGARPGLRPAAADAPTFGESGGAGSASATYDGRVDLAADPTWNALATELEALATACGAKNAIVADETNLLWCRARVMSPLETEQAFARLAIALGPDGGRDLARGHKLRHVGNEVPPFTYAESFAGIYVLLLWFSEPFVEFRVHGLVHRALPEIERLTVALPPPEGPETSTGAARKRA